MRNLRIRNKCGQRRASSMQSWKYWLRTRRCLRAWSAISTNIRRWSRCFRRSSSEATNSHTIRIRRRSIWHVCLGMRSTEEEKCRSQTVFSRHVSTTTFTLRRSFPMRSSAWRSGIKAALSRMEDSIWTESWAGLWFPSMRSMVRTTNGLLRITDASFFCCSWNRS